ncbi:hypothetical protein ALC53_02297 [Atta colombica]|uniref:Uncharacterized protein n=1 Tax=Atta colombica TaxID=520822 RepID=A0A195BSV9_9HYME|nr:hypothetical protein ALC53_02297 [Atta colombica]
MRNGITGVALSAKIYEVYQQLVASKFRISKLLRGLYNPLLINAGTSLASFGTARSVIESREVVKFPQDTEVGGRAEEQSHEGPPEELKKRDLGSGDCRELLPSPGEGADIGPGCSRRQDAGSAATLEGKILTAVNKFLTTSPLVNKVKLLMVSLTFLFPISLPLYAFLFLFLSISFSFSLSLSLSLFLS